MTLLQKYKLKASIRKSLDKLSDEDKIRAVLGKYDVQDLNQIITYYGLENHPLLRTLALDEYIKYPMDAIIYARDVIKGRWIEAEDVIKTDPYYSYDYAREIIKGRWIEGEDTIKTDPYRAYEYACYVIKGRWLEAEDIIKTDAQASYQYARDVIKGRWEEAEDIIKTDPLFWKLYQEEFIK